MKIGDLIQDKEYGDIALIIDIDHTCPVYKNCAYYILSQYGEATWFDAEYIENECEVIG